jgi:uncharacterized membrane protein YagU involved in acid resistance
VKRGWLSRLVRTWLLIAVTDAIFSSVLVTVFYHSTFARLWQGVASVLLGKGALDGGSRTVAIGLVMHFGVALFWTAVFLILYANSPRVRGAVASRYGVLKVASVYGPLIWLVMSLVVIPSLAHRPPTFNFRWLVQLIGHIPFVAVPIVWGIGRWTAEPDVVP